MTKREKHALSKVLWLLGQNHREIEAVIILRRLIGLGVHPVLTDDVPSISVFELMRRAEAEELAGAK